MQDRSFFLAKRFVAGETIDSAIAAARDINAQGMTATLDFLGEDITDWTEAQHTLEVYLEMLAAIERSGAQTNVSVKLTALGLLLDENSCVRRLTQIVERASRLPDPFVRIDMEGSAVTQRTLDVFETVFTAHRNVGPVIQAYLRRSPADVERLIDLGARVRLCKGAYRESRAVAYHSMDVIRREYLRLAEALLTRGIYPAIATHDERLIDAIKTFAAERRIGAGTFEFQMLYGVRIELQRRLVADGYRVRIYVPFGTHWASYFYRRVTERRENALFALRSLVSR
jgi:proline dehydrogenase